MYPPVVQFETRRLERELENLRAAAEVRAGAGAPAAAASPPAPAPARPASPPRHKLALLTWIGAWAVITLLLQLLGPVMAPWPLPLRTLLLSAVMVATLTWAITPTLIRIFRPWLFQRHSG